MGKKNKAKASAAAHDDDMMEDVAHDQDFSKYSDSDPLFDDGARAQMNRTAEGQARLALIAAIEDVVAEQKQALNATSFSAAVITALNSQSQVEEIVGNLLFLLAAIIRRVSPGVLKSKAAVFCGAVVPCTSAHGTSVRVLKPALDVLGVVLRSLDSATWNPDYSQVFDGCLAYTMDQRPKVRRSAQLSLASIMQDCDRKLVASALEPSFLSFLTTTLGGDLTNTAHVCATVRMCLSNISRKAALDIASKLLALCVDKGVSEVGTCVSAFSAIDVLFISMAESDGPHFPSSVSNLISTAKKLLKGSSGVSAEICVGYASMISNGLIALHAGDPAKVDKHASQIVTYLMDSLIAPFPDAAHDSISSSISNFLKKIGQNGSCEGDDSKGVKLIRKTTFNTLTNLASVIGDGLHPRYRHSYRHTIKVIGSLFSACSYVGHAFPLLGPVLTSLDEIRKHVTGTDQESVIAAIVCALQADGPEKFLKILPLTSNVNLEEPISELERGYLLPLIRDYLPPSPLAYWVESLLPLAKRFEASATRIVEQFPVAAKNCMIIHTLIWETLPTFTMYATDLQKTFPLVSQLLIKTMKENSDLQRLACRALTNVVKYNLDTPSGDDADTQDRIVHTFTIDEEKKKVNISAVASQSPSILPAIFDCCAAMKSTGERALLLSTAKLVVSITQPQLNSNMAQYVMKKLLAKEETDKLLYLDLLMTLVEHTTSNISLMSLRVCASLLTSEDAHIQKKSYVLCGVLANADPSAISQENVKAIVDAVGVCHSASKKHRMRCLSQILHTLPLSSPSFSPVLRSFLPEIILGCKEANHKTRECALDIIANLCHKFHSFTQSENRLTELVHMVVAGLAGETGHMTSATVVALGRMVYEYPQQIFECVPELLTAILLLFRHTSRELVGAAIGFVKVYVVSVPREYLLEKSGELVLSVLGWADESKDRFRLKIRVIFERMIRKIGYENVNIHVPPEHSQLMVYLRKENERKRKKAHSKEERENKSYNKAVGDSDDEEDITESYDNHKMVDDEENDEVDLLSASGVSAAQRRQLKKSGGETSAKSGGGDVSFKSLFMDDAGKTVIYDPEQPGAAKKRRAMEGYMKEALEELGVTEGARKDREEQETGKRFRDDYDENEDNEAEVKRTWGDGSFKKQIKQKRQRKSTSMLGGDEYKPADGVGGDVKRANRPDPFAYVPLDPKALNRKKGSSVHRQYESLFKANKDALQSRKKSHKR